MTPARFDQKVILQVNLITEDDRAGAYQTTFYQIERILTALDLIATTFLLILDFIRFVKEDIHAKQKTFTETWELGCLQVYLITLITWLLLSEGLVSCGRTFYGFRYA